MIERHKFKRISWQTSVYWEKSRFQKDHWQLTALDWCLNDNTKYKMRLKVSAHLFYSLEFFHRLMVLTNIDNTTLIAFVSSLVFFGRFVSLSRTLCSSFHLFSLRIDPIIYWTHTSRLLIFLLTTRCMFELVAITNHRHQRK